MHFSTDSSVYGRANLGETGCVESATYGELLWRVYGQSIGYDHGNPRWEYEQFNC